MLNHRNEVEGGTGETQVWAPGELSCYLPVEIRVPEMQGLEMNAL